MTSLKIKTPKLSDIILQQLENMILEGTFSPGQKLPAERELAKQFEVSRPSLREAIQKLEAKGLVTRKQGGGTYVSEQLEGGLTDPLFELISKHPESQFDLLEFRHALEGISAYYAALRGTESDFNVIQQRYQAIEQLPANADVATESQRVFSFYLAIAEASHNVVLLHLVRGMTGLLEKNIEQNLAALRQKQGISAQVNQHRKTLLDAIVAGEPELARHACNEHLAFIEETLLNIGRENSRIERSLRRVRKG
ncbi:pyruvate dehydrogenase complex transcriptional repressor PdhR [Flocculibacter collagenilyticus]|uniref:pyruvate dehydrogenase complex transcriptional repressor PdhR n=1 Tax=Flocculibacter collagenilyticus TaxID=2744479 RepID=UPI0018F78F9F|nr:pyruvate dehydrogenase complex transcriptional repressor PdhR [Flocculibacter collagenilyticus]